MERLSGRGMRNVSAIIPRMPVAILEAREDEDLIDLGAAENWAARDTMVDLCREAINTKLEQKHLSWPLGFYGMPKLLEAIAEFLNTNMRPAVPVQTNEMILAPGANGCVQALMWNICEAGDGVLIPAPFFFGFGIYSLLRAGVQVVPAPMPSVASAMDDGILDSLEKAYAESTIPIKALVISNPNNPIGRPWSRKILEGMYRFCQQKNLHFVSDEVFASVTYTAHDLPDPQLVTSLLELDAEKLGVDPWRTHVIWSPSKIFGMGGLRLGCVITRAGTDFRNGLTLASFTETSTVSSLLVYHILTSPSLFELLEKSSVALAERYKELTDALKELDIPYMPCNASLSVFAHLAPNATTWDEEAEIAGRLKAAGVIVSAGKGYQTPEMGWARLTFALEKSKLDEGIRRIKKVLRGL